MTDTELVHPQLIPAIQRLNDHLGDRGAKGIIRAYTEGAKEKRRAQNGRYLKALFEKANLKTVDDVWFQYTEYARSTVGNWMQGQITLEQFQEVQERFHNPSVPQPSSYERRRAGVIKAMEWVRNSLKREVVYDIDEEVYEHLRRLSTSKEWWRCTRTPVDMRTATNVGTGVLREVGRTLAAKPMIREVSQLLTCSEDWLLLYAAVVVQLKDRLKDRLV